MNEPGAHECGVNSKLFTCPGITMPQPPHAPVEGYVACYRAGHECSRAVFKTDDEHAILTEVRCSCCGEHYTSIYWLKAWATGWGLRHE